MMTAWMVLLAFGMGSLPFAVWLGRLALRGADVRQYGDGNPGATNALRAGGWRLGLAVLMLDVAKGAFPVGLAYFVLGLRGVDAWLVAAAAMVGHAYSPFLKGKGGKALAVMLGAWIGLTLAEMPAVVLTLLVIWYGLLEAEGWAVLFTALGGLAYLMVFHPDGLLIAVMAAQIALIVVKHAPDYRKRPALRQKWLRRLGAER